jgi:hypothetical protein
LARLKRHGQKPLASTEMKITAHPATISGRSGGTKETLEEQPANI